MSKSFEECYKTELLNELPDLWSRIEAGIREESTNEQPEEAMVVKEEVPVAVNAFKKKKPVRFWMYVTPVMAACLLGIIILPMGLVLFSGSDMTQAPAAMESADMVADDGAAKGEYAPEEFFNDMVAQESYAEQEMADSNRLEIVEIVVEIVSVQEDSLTFHILDNNAQEIAEEYELSEEGGSYTCLCETMEEVLPLEGVKYYAYLRPVRDEIYLGLLIEYNE